MSNFLTGGQVTAHKFRMFAQVMRIMARVSLVVIVLTFFVSFKINLTKTDWDMAGPIIKCEIWSGLDPNKMIVYTDFDGNWHKEPARFFVYNKTAKLVKYRFGLAFDKFIYISIAILVLEVLGVVAFFWLRGRSLKNSNQIRGAFLVTDKELKNQVTKYNKQFPELEPYTLAGIPYAATGVGSQYTPGEQSHTLVLGATGTGKTKVIQDLVKQLRDNNQKAIIVDIKGDYISHFYDQGRDDIILNPLDKRGTNWSFFKETDALNGFATIARTIINDNSRDQFWANSARQIFCELAKSYLGEDISMSAFVDEILGKDIVSLEKLLAKTPAGHLANQKAERTVACVLMMLAVHLAPLKLYSKTNEESQIFSIADWVNDDNKNNFLFISTSAEAKESLSPLIQIQVDIAINALRSSKRGANEPSRRPIWFILDELPYFDKSLPNLKDGLTTSRSYGGAFVLGTQDMSSLNKIYGIELARVIANNCRNKLIMNVDDSYTAQWCSDILGEGEVEEWSEGLSYGAHAARDGVSAHKHKIIKRAVLPAELSRLKTGQGYIKLPSFQPALISFKNCQLPKIVEGFVEDSEIKALFAAEVIRSREKRKELEAIMANGGMGEGMEILPGSKAEMVIEEAGHFEDMQ